MFGIFMALTSAICALPVPFMIPLNMVGGTLLVPTPLMFTLTLVFCANTIVITAIKTSIRIMPANCHPI